MDLSSAFILARLNTGTTTINLSDDNMLILANVVYRDMINSIVTKVNEDFFYDEWTTHTVLGQREYTFPVRSSISSGLKKVISIGVKYSDDDDYFRIVGPTKFSNLPYDPTYYEENQNEFNPFFTVADKSLFLYPKPTKAITGGLMLYGISDPKELILGATEADIKIPVDYHHVFAIGLESRIYKTRQMIDKETISMNEYTREVSKMITELSDRIIRPLESEMPYTTNLE